MVYRKGRDNAMVIQILSQVPTYFLSLDILLPRTRIHTCTTHITWGFLFYLIIDSP